MRTKAQILRDIAEAEANLVDLREELRNWERKESRAKSDAYRKRKALLDQTAPIFEEMVEVGDLIEVTGSRAGKWRRVVKLIKGRTYGDKWHCGTVFGHSVYTKKVRKPDGTVVPQMAEDVTKITDHGTNKIVAVYKGGRWIYAKELVDNG